MIIPGSYTLHDGERSMQIIITEVHSHGSKTTARAQPASEPIRDLIAKSVSITSGTGRVVLALVIRYDKQTELIDVTTQKYFAEHRRREYMAGRTTVDLELLLHGD